MVTPKHSIEKSMKARTTDKRRLSNKTVIQSELHSK